MHIIYVTAGLPFSRGETFFVPEVLELRRRGHRVTVIPVRPKGPVAHADARPLTAFSIAEPLLSLAIAGGALAEAVRAPSMVVRSVVQVVRAQRASVALKNLAVLPKALWLARLARGAGADHIHAQWAGTTATVALVASSLSGVPWSFTVHNWDVPEGNLLERKARSARFVRTIDARGEQELAGLAGVDRRKLRVIHLGVELPTRHPAARVRDTGPLRVLLGARLDHGKGHRFAFQAVAQLKANGVDVSLHCAGDGPLRRVLGTYARTLGVLDRVHFLGLVDHQDLLAQLRQHRWDVALLPSIETGKEREGIPVMLMEAMAAGVPVVSTGTGGIPELLGGGAGVLIPQQDAGATADALARLAHDERLRRQLAEAGLRRVRERFHVESSVGAVLDLIASGGHPGMPCR